VFSSAINTWPDNKVRERIAVKVIHTSLLKTTVVAFKILPLGSYAPMPAPVHPSKQFWNWFCGMAFRVAVVLLLMSSCDQNAFLSIFLIWKFRVAQSARRLGYGPDDLGSASRQGQVIFPSFAMFTPDLRSIQLPMQWILRFFPGVKCRAVKLISDLHLVTRLVMSGVIPLLFLYGFTAWTVKIFTF
jgi:hypothetical protein